MNRKERKRKRKQRDRKQRETETKTPRENPTQTHSREFKTSRRGVLQLANWRNQMWNKKRLRKLVGSSTSADTIGTSEKGITMKWLEGHKQTDHRHGQIESWPAKNHVRDEEKRRHLTYKTRGHYKDFFKIFFSKRDQVSQGRWPTYVGSNRYTKANSQTSIKLHRDNQP